MLKTDAWPYPVFRDLEYAIVAVRFENADLKTQRRSDCLVINGQRLRDEGRGEITVDLVVKTPLERVAQTVYGNSATDSLIRGVRLLCPDTKYRSFAQADADGKVSVRIGLEQLRGVVEITPQILAGVASTARNGILVHKGAVVAIPQQPIFLTIDEDWTGDKIPVRWEDFAANGLPDEALMHVHLSAPSQVPELWLNSKYRQQLEGVLLRTGTGSPVALAGAAMREFVWAHVWEKIVPWAIENENEDEPNWPSTRIARYWRSQFQRNGLVDLPDVSDLDAALLDQLSMQIQHCLNMAQKLSRVHQIARFQPEPAGPR